MFRSVSEETYKKMTEEIRYAILATDLATHFRLRAKILQACHGDNFDWNNPNHRYLLKANLITCCDLSGQCKPYSVAKKITENVYSTLTNLDLYKSIYIHNGYQFGDNKFLFFSLGEFYNQGDTEKNMGLTPLSMMDREKKHMIPADQVQFLSVVVEPCTEILMMLLPNTEQLNEECR